MTVTEMMFAIEKYEKEQKAYTDHQHRLRLKASEDFFDSSIIYTGCVVNTLRLMVDITLIVYSLAKLSKQEDSFSSLCGRSN